MKCPVCKSSRTQVIYSEPCEHRDGKSIMPEGIYHQALCKNCGLLFVESSVDDARLQAMYDNEYVDLKVTDELILDNLEEKESLIRVKYQKIRSLVQSGESKK